MARGCARMFGTRLAVSTTGFAETYREPHGLSGDYVTRSPVAFVSIYDAHRDSYCDVRVEYDSVMDRNAFRRHIVNVAKEKLQSIILQQKQQQQQQREGS
jgi:hypothetical protein